jgi:Tat protein secretion system quality control protein TatD with DNase activity
MIPAIAEKLAEIKNVEIEELYDVIRKNTHFVYGI